MPNFGLFDKEVALKSGKWTLSNFRMSNRRSNWSESFVADKQQQNCDTNRENLTFKSDLNSLSLLGIWWSETWTSGGFPVCRVCFSRRYFTFLPLILLSRRKLSLSPEGAKDKNILRVIVKWFCAPSLWRKNKYYKASAFRLTLLTFSGSKKASHHFRK